MTSVPVDKNELSYALCLAFVLLIPFAIAGLALINTGLGRSRSAAHSLTTSICVAATAMLSFFACGFAATGALGLHSAFFFRGVPWGWPIALWVPSLVFIVGLTSLIPIGAAADRWRLGAACASTFVLAAVTLPLFIRFRSITDSLSSRVIGSNFLDVGGSSFQVIGGTTALSIAWLLGPRQGKYSSQGMPAAIPAHNGVLVLFGCMLAWIGWLGMNSFGALGDSRVQPWISALVAVNTTFTASSSALTAAALTRYRFRKPDASLIANGWMAGLVASSAGCASFKPAIAVLAGMVAGILVVLSVEFFEFTLKVDDPCGSVSVHAVCGLWGLLAVGIFAGRTGQLLSQLVGIATLLGFVLPLTYGLNWLLGRFIPHRVSIDGERQGLDLHELGADAYPEFVVHADEFMQR